MTRAEQERAVAEYRATSPWHARNADRFARALAELQDEPEFHEPPVGADLPADFGDPEVKW